MRQPKLICHGTTVITGSMPTRRNAIGTGAVAVPVAFPTLAFPSTSASERMAPPPNATSKGALTVLRLSENGLKGPLPREISARAPKRRPNRATTTGTAPTTASRTGGFDRSSGSVAIVSAIISKNLDVLVSCLFDLVFCMRTLWFVTGAALDWWLVRLAHPV
jgi:hypothetical protein